MIKESFKQFFRRTQLNEGTATSFNALVDKMKVQLQRDDQAIKALMKLYARQRHEEQAAKQTRFVNYEGFNQPDAKFLSSLAQSYIKYGKLTGPQMYRLKQKITKYAGQLVNMAIQSGLIANPGRGQYSWTAPTPTPKPAGTIKPETTFRPVAAEPEKPRQLDLFNQRNEATEHSVDIEQILDIMEPNIDVPEEMTYAEFEAILKRECADCIADKSEEDIDSKIEELFNTGVGIPAAKRMLCAA